MIWMMQLYSKNTCEGLQFSNSKGIQRKRCILEYGNTYDWPVKYSMKQMHLVNRCVILNNFLSQVFILTILNYCYGQHNNLEK